MPDVLGLDEIFGVKARCAKRGCHFMAIAHSMHCARHQERREIEDRHGPIIEERAQEGPLSKKFAEADKEDDIAVAEAYQERVSTEEIAGRTAEIEAVEAEIAMKKAGEAYANDYQRTKAELLNAVRVPLIVNTAQVITLNGVRWPLVAGMNSVPQQIKQLYEGRQKLLAENELLQQVLGTENAGAQGHPHAYYEDVLKKGYRGDVLPAHDRASKR